ncbi:MAG: DJ-1/PfpI family protein [Dongiaceae bacterium]
MSPAQKTVALLLFPDVEVLDFAGPFEVFSLASALIEPSPWRVVTVADRRAEAGPVSTIGGLQVTPDHDLASCPAADILLVPGGMGSRVAMTDEHVLAWIGRQAKQAEIVASICTGALLLGRLGLLDGLRATTHWSAIDLLRKTAPKAEVVTETRYVDNGRIVTSAGISAGIDMSLYLVGRLCGTEAAAKVAHQMEYDWRVRQAA